ncbi:hypothetical protein Tco_0072662 [Tanacetum coccineum]
MDLMIPTGQKNTLAEYTILSGADNRSPILDKDLYDSWKSRMELYIQNREHGRMILESVEHSPLIWPSIEENRVTRTKKYVKLYATEKIQAYCDLKATNIILQGLPSDIYSFVNHHRVANDLWERIQLLMQVNTKFLNSLPPEWSKFMTDVKLVKDLHTTNFDQLHTYLQQHELHANKVRIMRERNHDPLALVANHQQTLSTFNTYQSSYNNPQFQQQFSPSQSPQYGSIHPTQHYSSIVKSREKCTEKEAKNIDTEIALEKKVKELDNIVCKMGQSAQTKPQQIRPVLYDGNVIVKETNMISIADSEETLMLEEESRSKMLLKQKLSDEQALHPNTDQSASSPVKIEAPRELPKVSLVNTRLKYHLGQFDNVVQKRITSNALTKGEWGFEHTKAVFQKEIIPFLKTLKDTFNVFDIVLLNEVTEVQTVFNQMEAAVQQYHVDKQCFEIQKKQFLIENDRLLEQIISQDIVNIVLNYSLDINTSVNVNSSVAMNDSINYVEMCNKYLELEAELIKQHNMVEKDAYNKLSKRFYKLEQHCISLEIAMQLNKEIFQKNNTFVNQTEPSFDQLFNLNNLKAELQAKDTTIKKLKANIKHLNKTFTTNSVKKDIDEIETINIELEHREKVFVITTLKNDLRKFKGKDIVDNAAQASNATTIAPGMYKLDPVTLAPKDKNNRETHIYYLKHTMEQASILREIVEQI